MMSAGNESLRLKYYARRHLLRRQAQRTVKLETFRTDAAGYYYESGP
jgi:hypothetical protein